MNKRIWILLLSFLLASCVSAEPTPPPATQQPTAASTPTPTQLPTSSPTPTATFTPASTETPTPASAVACPEIDPDVKIELPDLEHNKIKFAQIILDYLNAGGDFAALDNPTLFEEPHASYTEFIIEDVTNDNMAEVFFKDGQKIYVFSCQNGFYKNLALVQSGSGYGVYVEILDLTNNGIPEVVFSSIECNGPCIDLKIFEWDGKGLGILPAGILEKREGLIYGHGQSNETYFPQFEFIDVDGDGTLEIQVKDGIPGRWIDQLSYAPYRETTRLYQWNGEFFELILQEYSPPEYRHQAIQDGDKAALAGNYETAMSFYQDAIFSDELEIWTIDDKMKNNEKADFNYPTPTLGPLPTNGTSIYNQLSAYARFRIMLLHLLQGDENSAQVVYDNLVELFPPINSGHTYVEMAIAFWEEYQTSQDMGMACQTAVDYAKQHPEILSPMGGDYLGRHDDWYRPKDICPFE